MKSADAHALQLFREYIELSPAEQARAIARLRTADPDAHAIVSAMLDAHARPHPIDAPLPVPDLEHDDTSAMTRVGTMLGPWRIDRVIATGGMGTVYAAHRDDGHYRQRVALKCMRSDLAAPELLEAFRAEREHLARLEHPHIATLLDGGVDEDGAPWFAMRYVEGEPVDRWCDRHRLPLRARVELLLQACDALAHAHGQGIVHRDLKPSNLLVDAQGQLQVLDFGLSRLHADASSGPVAISAGYTAPEVIQGAAPDRTADIYSLGMVLVRLLCGLTQGRLLLTQAGLALADAGLPRLAMEAPPGTAALRGLKDEASLARRLAGDLNAIATRCIAPVTGQRYATVDEFADDLRRWLDLRPVRARGKRPLYRAGRFLLRHRLAAGLAGMVLISMLAGAAGALLLQARVEREAEATRSVATLLERTLGTATLSGLGETPFSSAELLRRTEAQLRALGLREQPKALAQALDSLARAYATIGDYGHATDLAAEAARLHEQGGAAAQEAQATLASLLNIQARHAEAQGVAERALVDLPRSDETRQLRLRLTAEAARSLWELGKRDRARQVLDTALTLAERDLPQAPVPYIELLTLRGDWRTRLYEPGAVADLDRAIALASPGHPLLADNARMQRTDLYVQYEDLDSALSMATELVASRRRWLGERHPETGRAWAVLASAQSRNGHQEEAMASVERAKRILSAAYGTGHPEYAKAVIMSLYIGRLKDGPIGYRGRIDQMRRALRTLRTAYGPAHESVFKAQARLGNWLLAPSPDVDMARYRAEGIAMLRELAASSRSTSNFDVFIPLNLARALMTNGSVDDLDEAEQLLAQAQSDVDRYFVGEHSFAVTHTGHMAVRGTRAQLMYLRGDLASADALLESLSTQIAERLPRTNARVAQCKSLLLHAAVASDLGERERARTYLLQLQDAAKPELGPPIYPYCARRAEEGLLELKRTGRYLWEPPIF